MRVNHNHTKPIHEYYAVVSDLCKDTKMRVNHNNNPSFYVVESVVSDLCKDTKMRVNHNRSLSLPQFYWLFLIYAKILK